MELNILDYIKPELLVLIPVLYFVGAGLKTAAAVADKWIPLLLGAAGIVLAAVWVLASSPLGGWQEILLAVFTAVVQGVLCAGGSVYANQVLKQAGKDE